MQQILNFFFVGNVDDATIEALLLNLASLPTTEKTVDLGYRMLKAT
jgi:hypothetical protein